MTINPTDSWPSERETWHPLDAYRIPRPDPEIERRDRAIIGLRKLAQLLEDCPELPTPHSITAQAGPDEGTWQQQRAAVLDAAAALRLPLSTDDDMTCTLRARLDHPSMGVYVAYVVHASRPCADPAGAATADPVVPHAVAYATPIAYAACEHCGTPMAYNLAAGICRHVKDSPGCITPWPGEPIEDPSADFRGWLTPTSPASTDPAQAAAEVPAELAPAEVRAGSALYGGPVLPRPTRDRALALDPQTPLDELPAGYGESDEDAAALRACECEDCDATRAEAEATEADLSDAGEAAVHAELAGEESGAPAPLHEIVAAWCTSPGSCAVSCRCTATYQGYESIAAAEAAWRRSCGGGAA